MRTFFWTLFVSVAIIVFILAIRGLFGTMIQLFSVPVLIIGVILLIWKNKELIHQVFMGDREK